MLWLIGILDIILGKITTIIIVLGKLIPLTKRRKIIIILKILKREIIILIKNWTIKNRPIKKWKTTSALLLLIVFSRIYSIKIT